MRDEREDELGSILDAALRDYSNREPRAGLDQRVLRQLHATSPGKASSPWIGWALIPISLAAIAVVVMTTGQDRPKIQAQPQVARVAPEPAPPPVPVIAKAATRRAKLPGPAIVPEPETLTSGERALLNFAWRDPEQARELFADSGQMKELKINPLEIEALP